MFCIRSPTRESGSKVDRTYDFVPINGMVMWFRHLAVLHEEKLRLDEEVLIGKERERVQDLALGPHSRRIAAVIPGLRFQSSAKSANRPGVFV